MEKSILKILAIFVAFISVFSVITISNAATDTSYHGASFDGIYLEQECNFGQGEGSASAKLDALSPARTIYAQSGLNTITLKGWAGFGSAITNFGYMVDGDKTTIVWDSSFTVSFANEDDKAAVCADRNGGQYAKRYSVSIPVSNYDNTHTFVVVAKVGTKTISLDSTLAQTGDGSVPNTEFIYVGETNRFPQDKTLFDIVGYETLSNGSLTASKQSFKAGDTITFNFKIDASAGYSFKKLVCIPKFDTSIFEMQEYRLCTEDGEQFSADGYGNPSVKSAKYDSSKNAYVCGYNWTNNVTLTASKVTSNATWFTFTLKAKANYSGEGKTTPVSLCIKMSDINMAGIYTVNLTDTQYTVATPTPTAKPTATPTATAKPTATATAKATETATPTATAKATTEATAKTTESAKTTAAQTAEATATQKSIPLSTAPEVTDAPENTEAPETTASDETSVIEETSVAEETTSEETAAEETAAPEETSAAEETADEETPATETSNNDTTGKTKKGCRNNIMGGSYVLVIVLAAFAILFVKKETL